MLALTQIVATLWCMCVLHILPIEHDNLRHVLCSQKWFFDASITVVVIFYDVALEGYLFAHMLQC